MRLIDEHATLDWTLDKEKWKCLLVAAQVLNGLLSYIRRRKNIKLAVNKYKNYTL
jgi:hypothetical protein